MVSKLTATICCFMLSCALYAQNGWLPPANFPGNTQVCDPASWKLVLSDDFNGNTLSSNWIDYFSWDGMSQTINGNYIQGDHENWSEARCPHPYTSIKKSSNVIVNGGSCKLLIKKDPNSTWTYPGGPTITKQFTSAVIATPYHLKPNGADNYFNAATKFEARIKFPTFRGSWCAFWIWNGTGVNEIDMAEAWGGIGSPFFGDGRRTQFNCGAWFPEDGNHNPSTDPLVNPYNITENNGISNMYPNQSWWDFITRTNFRQEDYHTYTYYWDTAVVTTFLDNIWIKSIWKYYQDRRFSHWEYNNGHWDHIVYEYRVGSECSPDPGTWNVTWGFPYKNDSECQLRLESKLSEDHPEDLNNFVYTKGVMEIDYVKVWQRHPEQDGHTDLCSGNAAPVINGPSQLCNTTAYNISPVQPGGEWSTSNNAVMFGGGTQNGSSRLIYPNPNSPYTYTTLYYTYTPTILGCPPVTVSKNIMVSVPGANIACSRNWSLFTENFTLIASPPIAGATYSWEIDYGFNSNNLYHYTTTGPIAHTPSMNHWGIIAYYVKWKLTITTSCGERVIKGFKNNMSYFAPSLTNAATYMEPDSSAAYLETRFNGQDSIRYMAKVHSIVANSMVAADADTTEIIAIINKAKADALEPYLYFEDRVQAGFMKGSATLPSTTTINETHLYPNPANDVLYITPGASFEQDKHIHITIHDIAGKLVQTTTLNNMTGGRPSIDISSLEDGNYIVTLKQDKHTEHHKLLKRK